jgi:hypothetical protein
MGSPEITPGMQGVRVAFDHLVEGQRPFDRYAAAVAPSPVIDLTDGFAHYQEKFWAESRNSARI